MAKPPTVDEKEFLKITRNHGEFSRTLRLLGLPDASTQVVENAQHVALRWFYLAIEHIVDAKAAEGNGLLRASYSRSYYAAYNASKSIRYICTGSVTLTGDDHKNASDLPDDFPDVEKWTAAINNLREHRLKADYDNWASTAAELSLTPQQAVHLADAFTSEAAKYLETKYGIIL
jgi:hypothetical protein